jgi:MFS family permease
MTVHAHSTYYELLTRYFRQDYGDEDETAFIVPSSWLLFWNASIFLGQMIGAIWGGWVQDKYGRRISLLLGSSISAVAVAVCFASYLPYDVDNRRSMFLAGKTIIGVAHGILLTTAQTFISEITPPDLRGSALALLPTNNYLGQLIGFWVVYALSHDTTRRAYQAAIATQWLFTMLFLVFSILTPESPAYLVAKGRFSVALGSLAKLHTSRVDLPAMLEQVRRFVTVEDQFFHAKKYLDCLRSRHRRQTLIVLVAGIIPQLFGLSLLSQSNYFMQVVGMTANLSLGVLGLGIILGFFANFIGLWLVGRVGRRRLILAPLAISALLWFGMGVAGFWSGDATVWLVVPITIRMRFNS